MRKKKDKGIERKTERKGRSHKLKAIVCYIAFENLKRDSFLYVALGAVPGEYITYPSFQVNNPYISVGCKTHLRKRLT